MPKKGQTYAAIIRKLDLHELMLNEIKKKVDEVRTNGKDNRKDINESKSKIAVLESKNEAAERRIGNHFLIWAAIIAGIAGTVASLIMKFI